MRALARKSGLSAPYIATIERGTSEPPPLRTCKALARALGMQPEEIWRRAFAARLEKWLKRQRFSHISSEALLEISKRIEEADKQAR
jgi:transcriptional regulator with XRE-family HTH domain